MTGQQAWVQMCADFLEDNPEAKGLRYIEDATTGASVRSGSK